MGKIKGVVVSERKEQVVASTLVTIYLADKEVWSFTTGSDGIFTVSLPTGKYAIKVTANGYKPYINRNVNITDVGTVYMKVVLMKDVEILKDKVVKTIEEQKLFITSQNLEKKLVLSPNNMDIMFLLQNQVEFNPAFVKAYRLIGYEKRLLNKEDFNNDKKDAGEIDCAHSVTALYEVVPASSDEKVSTVDPLEYQKSQVVDSKYAMTVKLRYKKPNEDKSILMVNKYKPGAYTDSNNIKFAATVAQFGMLLRDSEFKGPTTWANVIKMAKEAKGLDEYGYRNDFVKMIEMAEMLAAK